MYQSEDPQTIQSMFNSIAERYDFTNAVLSISLHKYWNHALVEQIKQKHPQHVYLDLCAGTGDIAFDYLRTIKIPSQTYLVDFSSEMLEKAKIKGSNPAFSQHQIHYIEADVLQLPFSDNEAHCATMAYGIRNVQNPSDCLKEVYRILKPGGCFGILELTRPQNPILRFGHHVYLKTFLPLLGKICTSNRDAYHYLCKSIDRFIAPAELEKLMQREGFENTRRISLSGGIATLLLGCKPSHE